MPPKPLRSVRSASVIPFLLGLLALSQFGPYAMLGVAVAAGALWYGVVMRWLKKRTIDGTVERFTATVEPKRR